MHRVLNRLVMNVPSQIKKKTAVGWLSASTPLPLWCVRMFAAGLHAQCTYIIVISSKLRLNIDPKIPSSTCSIDVRFALVIFDAREIYV